jgi:hypothetical protein
MITVKYANVSQAWYWYTWDPRTQERDAGGLPVQGQTGLHKESLSLKKNEKKKKKKKKEKKLKKKKQRKLKS